MNERQKLQLGLQTETEHEDIHCNFDVIDGREENPTVETLVDDVSLEKQSHDQNITPKDKKGSHLYDGEKFRLRLQWENFDVLFHLNLILPNPEFDVTPRKVNFLKQLANSLESQNCAPKKVPKAKPTRLTFDELESIAQPDLEPQCEQLDVENIYYVDSPNKMPWEESVMSSGVKKIKLVPEYEVYLTQGQLSQAIHTGSSQPRKLTIALLDCFFTKEMLARSSAKGARNAHNATFKTTPLPAIVIRAIKDFVLKHFKKEL